MSDVDSLIQTIADQRIRICHLRFTDTAGHVRQISIETGVLNRSLFTDGFMIDGSAVPGWHAPTEPDPVLRPDAASSFVDPFAAQPTKVVFCSAVEAGTSHYYDACPRGTLERTLQHVQRGLGADQVSIGMELGFSLFDDVQFDQEAYRVGHRLTAMEAPAASGQAYQGGNPGHRPAARRAAFVIPPPDHFSDLRSEIATILAGCGIPGVTHGHGRGACQHVLILPPAPALVAADRLQIARYVVQNVAAGYGKSATFVPKPSRDEHGVDLVMSVAAYAAGRALFHGSAYADLSPLCLSFMAGILAHAPMLAAFTNPSTNSYRRLRPGEEVPTVLAYAANNRTAAVRIPLTSRPEQKRLELRFPDPLACPYLSISAMLLAGLHGVARKLEPDDPLDRNLYDLPAEEHALRHLPRSLDQALDDLDRGREVLTAGDCFCGTLIDTYLALKRAEADEIAAIPHPAELRLYWSN
ncbi:MAG TPA: glutamine synthetase beta-grasp domain-containing protein [Geminicoccus sp.]|uniref:glutamine synthetase beta-grasp domain-containing protein n=1 Tax=Geminicoccus sp. TaxID=2024832 RepID=UPI002E2F807E|nr:glutamine synthetase beta-grasp domain-containing protein [Geminicoccus sp.]HEX2528291.1 glutamine synthetase beta-grasp domain-containing protein [Geminicoccus sp.]